MNKRRNNPTNLVFIPSFISPGITIFLPFYQITPLIPPFPPAPKQLPKRPPKPPQPALPLPIRVSGRTSKFGFDRKYKQPLEPQKERDPLAAVAPVGKYIGRVHAKIEALGSVSDGDRPRFRLGLRREAHRGKNGNGERRPKGRN